MYIKRRYSFWMVINWSKWPFIIGVIYSYLICTLSVLLEAKLSLPWGPLTVIGIAVAFYLGFKNNSSYERTWEARKIWGAIVNNSRTFGAAVLAFVQGENTKEIQQELIYRHIAWMTALRHQLRLPRTWEHQKNRVKLYAPSTSEDFHHKMESELKELISNNEVNYLKKKTNQATQILKIQSEKLQKYRDQGYFEDFRHMELHQLIKSFYEDQGKAERIKNFPFPRQYASVAFWITLIFSIFIPFGMNEIMDGKQDGLLWFAPFMSGLIIWVFFLMEKIGDYSENPFEGTYNDVPITNISRGIEIDLRQMLDEENTPPPTSDENGFLM
ncbi:bestrophin family protein [Mesonia sp. K7]|uniref:bestrophin family protein n=1 Tax=Mesonia sp. K7 TaxID=2218606 RepID=UPI000DAA2405|nr:bestrophin family ion channel [Mesonia sp. K7]PZD77854.1 hypothetical protein DNG35_07080 [Mesonia sp. K7]